MRSRFSVVLTLLICTAFLMPGPAQADPVTEPLISVKTTTKLTGHGFGHGRGMSQYGAQGAALRSVQSHQIVNFYYPGTTVGSFSGEIRVLIGGDNDNDTVVLPTAGLAIFDYGVDTAYKLPLNGAKLWKLFTSDGLTRVSYLSATGWKRYALGGQGALVGVGEFRSSSYKLTLRTPDGDRKYRGALRYINQNTINRLSMESYLKGVVPLEMPASWRADALEAQSIAARSYAARELVDHLTRSYHVWDDPKYDQVYGGLSAEVAKSNEAVVATAGIVRMYGGKPAFTEFSSSNGGWSSAGATQAYLVAQQDPYEKYSSNPNATWTVSLNAATLEKAYPEIGTLKWIRITERDGSGEWGGRVQGLKLGGSNGTKVFGTAAELDGISKFRSVLGLKSTYFTITN